VPSSSCSRHKARSSDRNLSSRRPCKLAANQSLSEAGSCSSLASETSSDYAFPPEDGASVKTDSSDVCPAATTTKSSAVAGLDSYKKVDVFLFQHNSYSFCRFLLCLLACTCVQKYKCGMA